MYYSDRFLLFAWKNLKQRMISNKVGRNPRVTECGEPGVDKVDRAGNPLSVETSILLFLFFILELNTPYGVLR